MQQESLEKIKIGFQIQRLWQWYHHYTLTMCNSKMKILVFQLARERVFWPGMEKEICHHIQKVCYCSKKMSTRQKHVAPLGTITKTLLLQIIGIDFLHLNTCRGGYEHLLVVTNHFNEYAQSYLTRDKSAQAAAGNIYNNFFLRFKILENTYHIFVEYRNHIQHTIIYKLISKQSVWTSPYIQCWKH